MIRENYTIEDFKRRDVNDQQSLTDALSWASYKYYVENDTPMSDFEFDMEFRQLQKLEAANGCVLPDSPTQRVGSDIQGAFEKHRHIIPMQSIENVYTDGEMQAWLGETARKLKARFPGEEVTFTFEPKYDGLSISLVYTDGVLTDAVTRGNQVEGESVWQNVRTIRNVPLQLDRAACPELPAYFEVRGEVLMPQGAFDRLNAEREKAGEKPFANKRNAASGSLKQLDPKITSQRGLLVMTYAAYSTDRDFQRDIMPSQVETLHLLKRLGFSYYRMDRGFADLAELTREIDAFNRIRTSHTLPYDCDGVVIKVNERRHQEFLGLNTTFPNWCKARKFPQEAQSTLMHDVTFQVGMTGHVTPVAELDPTTISGSVVARATLNNESFIRNMGLQIGSYVFVQKAGEVIPQVSAIDTERNRNEEAQLRPIHFPTACPECDTHLIKKGEYWICPNHHCRAQIVQRLEYWCGKDCANIAKIGPSVMADLVGKMHVESVNDFYELFCDPDAGRIDNPWPTDSLFYEAEPAPLAQRLEDALGEGYGPKSISQMIEGVQGSVQTLTLDRMIGGLGIDGVGKITGKVLAAHFGTLDNFRHATFEDLVAVDGIGEIMARNILEFLSPTEGHIDDYSCLWNPVYGFRTTYEAAEKLGDSLAGKTVIFTGTSYRFKRDEIKNFFAGHGAKYVSSVSGKVDYVITGDAPGGNKLQKARELGVEIIGEREFYEKFNI